MLFVDKYQRGLINTETLLKANVQYSNLIKAFSHKYLRKEADGKGGYKYIYDKTLVSHKWGDDDVISPNNIFSNKVQQKTKNDITTFFIKNFNVKSSHKVPLDKRKGLWSRGEIKKINISDVVPSQDYINISSLREDREKETPLGISIPNSNKIVVFDGHHRIAKKIIDGEEYIEIKTIPSYGLFKHLQTK